MAMRFWMFAGGTIARLVLTAALSAAGGAAWAQAQTGAAAAELPILKCPEVRKNCAVGVIVESGQSYSFRIFQASEEVLVGKRRQLASTAQGQRVQSLDLGPLNGRVLVVEYDDSDRRSLLNVRIITTVTAGR